MSPICLPQETFDGAPVVTRRAAPVRLERAVLGHALLRKPRRTQGPPHRHRRRGRCALRDGLLRSLGDETGYIILFHSQAHKSLMNRQNRHIEKCIGRHKEPSNQIWSQIGKTKMRDMQIQIAAGASAVLIDLDYRPFTPDPIRGTCVYRLAPPCSAAGIGFATRPLARFESAQTSWTSRPAQRAMMLC